MPIEPRSEEADGEVRYSGGDGSSPEKAVVVHAPDKPTGIRAEYLWIGDRFGTRGIDYDHTSKDLVFGQEGHVYDVHHLTIAFGLGGEVEVWFDISGWFYDGL